MPFTISHAAAALPLRRLTLGRLPLSALVIGAMSPDFEYPLRLAAVGRLGHTPAGLFTFCLPLGFAVFWFFELRLWPWLEALASERSAAWLAGRPAFHPGSPRAAGAAALGILLGAASHVVWDSATHWDGWIVQRIGLLQAHLLDWRGLHVSGYEIAQHLSSLLGLAVLARAWAEASPLRWRRTALWLFVAAPLVGGAGLAALSMGSRTGGPLLARLVVQFAVGWLATLAACLLCLGLFRAPKPPEIS